MLKKANDRVAELRAQMRGGKGTVKIAHLFDEGVATGKIRLCAEITLDKGCSIGEHAHDGEDEIFYFVQGEGVVLDQGVAKKVKAGDAMLTGNGGTHAVENTGEESLVILAIIVLYE